MTGYDLKALLEADAKLEIGREVIAYWGYGSGFRAKGKGRIVKIFPKSVRVELLEDVQPQHSTSTAWPAGFILKSIPRAINIMSWNRWNCVALLTPDDERAEPLRWNEDCYCSSLVESTCDFCRGIRTPTKREG